ncbi:MAG: HEAT repeat domain-containing protein [Planctomycetota bacterium]
MSPSRLHVFRSPLHIAVVFGLCLGATVSAQQPAQRSTQKPTRLQGVYTVDPDGQGERNFQSITAAVQALAKRGVRGPVKLVVAAGTYQEAVTLDPIDGVDEDSPVTFQAAVPGKVVWNGKKVEKKKAEPDDKGKRKKKSLFWAAAEAAGLKPRKKKPARPARQQPEENTTVVLGESVEHLVFDGLVFEETVAGAAIFGHPGASYIEIRNCRFGKGIKGHRGREGVIYVNGSSKAEGWRIHHNVFDLPGISSGMYFSQIKRFHIQDNRIKLNGNSSGMYFINENRAKNRIERNLITGETDGSNGSCAINVALSNLNNDIADNTIIIESRGHAIRTFGTQTNFNRIYSNLIVVTGGGAGIHVGTGTLNHFESDSNLFFIESNNVGTWNNAMESGLEAWREATGLGPRGAADEGSTLGDPEMIATVNELIVTQKGDTKARLKIALLLLGTADEAGKRLAARVCSQMGTDARVAIPHLALLCHHPSAGLRADAAAALGAMGEAAAIAVPELLKLLDDNDRRVVTNAAATLGNCGPLAAKAVPKLLNLAADDPVDGSDQLQQVSIAALRKIDPDNPAVKKLGH